MSKKRKYNRFTTSTKHNRDNAPITAIILGATPGKRMRSLGPKSTFKIHKNTLLDYQLQVLQKKFPNLEAILTVGYKADEAINQKDNRVRIVENTQFEYTNCTEELRRAINNTTTNRVLITYADILFNLETIKNISNQGSSVAILIDEDSFDNKEVGVTVVNDFITIFSYGLPTKWAHIIYLEENELNILRDLVFDREKEKWFIFEVFNKMLNQGGKIKALKPKGMNLTKINSRKVLGDFSS